MSTEIIVVDSPEWTSEIIIESADTVVIQDVPTQVDVITMAEMGAQGVQGEQGIQGEPGPPGADGVPGPIGPAGPQGVQGEQGVQGVQGIQGIQGEPGPPGADGGGDGGGGTGPAGPAGPQGIQGEQGVQGPAGPQGVQGPKGDDGAPGEPGEPGDSVDVYQQDPEPTVAFTGDMWISDTDYEPGQGPPGPMGPMGPAGLAQISPVVYYTPGRYYDQSFVGGSKTTGALALNRLYLVATIIYSDITIQSLHVNLTTAGAGAAVARIGIWNVNAQGLPSTLVYGSNQFSTFTTGLVGPTGLTLALPADRYYFGVVAQVGVCTVSAHNPTQLFGGFRRNPTWSTNGAETLEIADNISGPLASNPAVITNSPAFSSTACVIWRVA